ncbi:hypothetical protein N8T08_000859 [Aspergillus melleus]|uniref:Uncharacterized protein n=1 Tax=Aspergillus melleus TaxID=138277 RepID=A0ACC3BAS2_9EURO|nr:hypothetical protein N8T08_000859 [Aspergillus melleus]
MTDARMSSEDGTSAAQPPRKVRSACRRCRQKRVKCDGTIPACGNCARAKVPCVDVHGGNNDLSIPRDFAVRCCARIKWLEQQICSLHPEFDLSQGPRVNVDFMERLSSQGSFRTVENDVPDIPPRTAEVLVESTEETGNKRSHTTMEDSEGERPISAKARSVAIDLGMLSLQSDSRQKYYLGSSSGLFFTKLVGLDSELLSSNPTALTTAVNSRRIAPLHISNEIYQSLYSRLDKELPSPEDARILLEVYFQHIHIDHPFLHPASLVHAYNALRSCVQRGYHGSVDRNGWIHNVEPFPYNGKFDLLADQKFTPISVFIAVFHVFMAMSLAATVLTRKKNYDFSPSRFHRMAISTASECFSSISTAALQAILLLAVQSTIEPAGLSIWTLSHLAMSHCVDLGLHREPSDNSEMSSCANTIRRFIFYTVYSLDRSIATIQGRPLGIRDETFDVSPPTNADIADMLTVSENELTVHLPSPQHLALSICRFKLDQHISEIKILFYHLPTQSRSFVWPTGLSDIQARIKSDLDCWLSEVSGILPTADMEEDEILKLHYEKMRHEQLYHSTVALLFQPSQVFPSPTHDALSICYHSSSKRLQIYDILGSREMLYYSWRNIHGIFSSGATIVYCAWASRGLQGMIPFSKLMRDLRICSNHLSIGSQWWPSVRDGKESFEKMIDVVTKHLSHLHEPSSLPPRQRRRGSPKPQLDLRENGESEVGKESVNALAHDGTGIDRQTRSSVFQGANAALTPMSAQPLFDGQFDFLSLPFDPIFDELDVMPIESAMENFMAEYLHDDWGWDPFSGSMGPSDNHAAGPT